MSSENEMFAKIAEEKGIKIKLRNGFYKFRAKHGRSPVWKTFAEVVDENGAVLKNIVACRKCYGIYNFTSSTSNLVKHRCHRKLTTPHKAKESEELETVCVDIDSKKAIIDIVTKWTIENCRCFQIISDSGLRELAAVFIQIGATYGDKINVDKCMPHPTTVSRNVRNLYQTHLKRINEDIIDIKTNGYSITPAVWNDLKMANVSVTVHFISDGHFYSRLLAMPAVKDDNVTDSQIKEKVESTLREFNLELKSAIVVVDSSSKMGETFNNNEQIHCICQLLNDIVVEAFKVIPELNEMLSHRSQLEKYIETSSENINLGATLKNFCPTKWNSIYYLLMSIKDNWQHISAILNENNELSNLRIDDINAIVKVLAPFEKSSKTLEKDNEPTLHMVIPHLHRLKKVCAIDHEDIELISKLKSHLYWSLETVVELHITKMHKIALFLFPPSNQLQQFGDDEKARTIEDCKAIMQTYNTDTDGNEEVAQNHNSSADNVFTDFVQSSSQKTIEAKINREINGYINTEETLQQEFDVLEWWEGNKAQFPQLYKLSCRILGTPASCASSKRIHSAARKLNHGNRSSLPFNDERLNEIVFLHYNMK